MYERMFYIFWAYCTIYKIRIYSFDDLKKNRIRFQVVLSLHFY